MKRFLLIICTFWCFILNAQLDTEHWFAPMSAKAGTGGLEGYLYLSTNETVPFSVQIFNNNTLYTTVQVSKNNPTQVIIPNNFLIASAQNQLFTPNNMGLNVKGPKKFFANYRFAMSNHAEILTSKGAAGLGTTFYAGVAPISGSENHMNATIGVTATEDNTVVTISGYNPSITFSDGISSPTRTFTLNKGKSYILDVVSSTSNINKTGLVGAKIVATKAISVTNGNFNAAYTSQNLTNNDILMDQAVPVDRLGKDFVVVKGNGTVTSEMETALIIATENNTQITFNGSGAVINLNEGQHYLVPSTRYQHQGNGHYNMNISSTKNVYVYQLLSGATNGNEYASGGMNFIPPLSCFMPNKIDEIGFINRIGGQTFATRLNIITQVGATVTLNGGNIAAGNGPYPVTGNPNWVSYSIQNVTGNVTLNSTKAMTAGIAAGSGAVGYGGYFAGFSSVPAITKTGDCYAGILLQVDNNYDGYQWYLNGVAIPGATTFSINPELYGAGAYTCSVTKNNCETKLTTIYNYTLCPPISTTTFTIGSCNTKVITPAFTSSTQTIVPSLTAIISQPTNGTATVNPTTGQITYTPNATTVNTTDQFVYYIQGNGNPFAFEYFRIIINTDVHQVNNASISICNSAAGNGTYNLTTASVTSAIGANITYFTNANLTGQITDPTNYTGPAGIIYANVTSAYGCSKVTQITLTMNPAPNINTSTYNAEFCDDNSSGVININFATVTPQIVTNSANFTVKYYLNQADATAGNNNTLPTNWNYSTNTTVYVRVESTNGCPPAFGQINFVIKNKVPLLTPTHVVEICDTDMNGSETVNLNTYKNIFTTDPGTTVTFHNSLADAQSGANAIPATQTINNGATGTFYLRFTNATQCFNTASLAIKVNAVPNINIANFNGNLCDDNFDGIVNVNFSTITPQIVTNSANFTVRYYLSQADANAGNTNTLPTNWTYTSATTVYIRVDGISTICPTAFGQINFTIGNKITLLTTNFTAEICDNDLNDSQSVNLNDYRNQFIADPSVTLSYHATLADAQSGINGLAVNQIITTPATFYIRFTSNNGCPNTATLKISLRSPKKSEVLKDQIICSNDKAALNAGDGFTSYLWSTGATTSTITVGVGTYYVDLGFNGCTYRQTVTITAAQAPTITSIVVTGTTATINVTGGNAPYQYSLNGSDYQNSNVFTGLSRGPYKVYVIGKDGCQPVIKDFLILNLINTITPNGDGRNDVLDYSDLRIKDQVSIEVVDRYGAAVYKSSGNNYKWDGKSGGRNLSTGTYWYIIKWIEPDTKLPVSHSGWLLIKNRE
ncbi:MULTISPECIES: gliding motility-associated C-terminal domain-containing protein [Chryseobacterium]|uniref:T9SS type B sorting domain-containing protein n=1 Tax=Chryseobacterium TaxID=59732 RepID=UPI0019581FE0|nr:MULTISPECIES: gliding motility-associated C-terminal domain-containing protein [Chryseobacterium]MBM7418555.1 gliding motility-associated-like protein [Chryseobacterium sp. JUb44]MDH6208464.1 gliding motility-associated-like protein [Chryseobacterium sp. BIGb0186]WSO11356.1 gliding motility-associated C-terminal domain-containing protein [Chryseobacterium scophthalmum]